MCFNAKKVLLIQDNKRYKKVHKKLRYVSTNQDITSLFLQRTFVAFCFNAIENENFDEFYNKTFLNRYDDDIYNAILIIIDRFLKMTHYIFVKST